MKFTGNECAALFFLALAASSQAARGEEPAGAAPVMPPAAATTPAAATASAAATTEAKSAPPVKIAGPFEVEVHRGIAYTAPVAAAADLAKPAVESADEAPKDAAKPDGSKPGEAKAPEADPKQKLDLYLPKGQKDYPVLIFVHGGAWVFGDRQQYVALGQTFARNGVGVVVMSYRLTPQVKHPGHIEDVARAFAWTHGNIARYGGRADRIFVSGQSAGGHLAALLATNETYLKAVGRSRADIRGVVPISGVYAIPRGRLLERVFGDTAESIESASPLRHIGGQLPPFLVLYADSDMRGCDIMSNLFTAQLKKNKTTAECLELANRNHITIIFSLMRDEADPGAQAMLKFIAEHSELKLRDR